MLAAVIPMKQLIFSKSRLSNVLNNDERQQLALFMLKQMLNVLTASRQISKVIVISSDAYLKDWLASNYKSVKFIAEDCDLNKAAEISSHYLSKENYGSMLFCLGDLPLINSADLDFLIKSKEKNTMLLVPDKHKKGTNALLVSPPDLMKRFYFGQDSLSIYLANAKAGAVNTKILNLKSFSYDVDNPEDLIYVKKINLINKRIKSLNFIVNAQEVS